MALQGDVETLGVHELFAWLAERQASGQLSLGRGMVARRFHLRAGKVVLASSTEQDSLLGQRLLERGLLKKHQLSAVLLLRHDSGERLGQTLHASGYVSEAALRRVLSDKIEELLVDTLTWTEGRFFFDDAALPRETDDLDAPVDLRAFLAALAPVAVAEADVLEVRSLRKRAAKSGEDPPPSPRSPEGGMLDRGGRPNRAA